MSRRSAEPAAARRRASGAAFGLVADPMDPRGFYVSHRKKVGEQKTADGVVYDRYRYYAQRWEPRRRQAGSAAANINIPGPADPHLEVGAAAGEARMFLTQDTQYRTDGRAATKRYYVADHRLSLLRQVTVAERAGGRVAGHASVLTDLYPAALLVEADKLLINGRPQKNYWYGWRRRRGGRPACDLGTGEHRPAARRRRCPAGRPTSDRLLVFDMTGNKLDDGVRPADPHVQRAADGHPRGQAVREPDGQRQLLPVRRSAAAAAATASWWSTSANPAAPRGVRFLRTLGFATPHRVLRRRRLRRLGALRPVPHEPRRARGPADRTDHVVTRGSTRTAGPASPSRRRVRTRVGSGACGAHRSG